MSCLDFLFFISWIGIGEGKRLRVWISFVLYVL